MSNPQHFAPSLAAVLLALAKTVDEVIQGVSLTESLTRVPSHLRPAVQALSFSVMRNFGRALALKRFLVKKAPPHPHVDALLLSALALLSDENNSEQYTPFTLVNQAVEAVAKIPRQFAYKGLINASLRRFLREKEALLAQVSTTLSAQWNYPSWWINQVKKDYPLQWKQILQAGNERAPMVLRVNQRKISGLKLREMFSAAGISSHLVPPVTLFLDKPMPVQQLPGFNEGYWSVQDAGAQQAARLLAPKPGARVLDACAAPGGKTAHLLEQYDIDLLAVDVEAERLARVGENLQRLGLHAELKLADIANLNQWWDGRHFDAILADVPCTASGIVRRHPDIRWLRRETDIMQTVVLQKKIIDALWQTLVSGGKFLYVTCSVFPAEGEKQIEHFLASHSDALRLEAPGQLLPSGTDADFIDQHDGFFYALLTKQ